MMVRHASRSLAGVSVLLVEDHDDAREMMSLLLATWGAEVMCAERADRAYELASSAPFDLLMTDIGLPTVDGLTMLRELRRRGYTQPAIALTGYTSVEDRKRAVEAGFDAHLSKPSDPDELLATIRRLVEQARATTAASPEAGAPSADAPLTTESPLQEGGRTLGNGTTGENV